MEERINYFFGCNILPQIIPFLAGFLTAIFAEPIRRHLFKPELKLDFENNNDFVALTPERISSNSGTIEIKANYIRIKVTNIKNVTARDCKAYLINIEKLDIDNNFSPTIYCDSIPIAWSCQNIGEQYCGININKGANQYADVVTTRHLPSLGEIMYPKMVDQHAEPDILYPQIKVIPLRYEEIFKDRGKFRFTIQVTSSNADPKTIRIVLDWNGVWDNFSVRKE